MNDHDLYLAVQEQFERRYKRRRTYNKWLKLYFALVVPMWVVIVPIIAVVNVAGGGNFHDVLLDKISFWLTIFSAVSGLWFLLRGIDVYFLLDNIDARREMLKRQQFQRELDKAIYAEAKAKHGEALLGDDGEMVYAETIEKPKRRNSAEM